MEVPFSKAYGCLVGLAIGDALGSATEEMSPSGIKRKFGRVRGFVGRKVAGTDDTEYAMLTAMILVENNGVLNHQKMADGWLRHLEGENEFSRGGASEWEALQNLKNGIMPPKSGSIGTATWSDGAAMRIAPVGIYCAGNPEKAARLAKIDACVSNSNDGVYCSQSLAASIAKAFTTDDVSSVLETGIGFLPMKSASYRLVSKILRTARGYRTPESALGGLYALRTPISTWYAPEALGYAYAMFELGKGKFVKSVLGAVNLGRDADTIAAMTGALCGAMGGIETIPDSWVRKCRTVKGTCIRNFEGIDIKTMAGRIRRLRAIN
jgi:ADP-ribosylglycohydrolase